LINLDIKLLLDENGITQKEVAAVMGIRHDSLSRILRKPLSPMRREQVIAAISEVRKQKGGQ
jgi:predicted XRE-type DNA-binding protein